MSVSNVPAHNCPSHPCPICYPAYAKPFDPFTSPGMTDLMVTPESIGELPNTTPKRHLFRAALVVLFGLLFFLMGVKFGQAQQAELVGWYTGDSIVRQPGPCGDILGLLDRSGAGNHLRSTNWTPRFKDAQPEPYIMVDRDGCGDQVWGMAIEHSDGINLSSLMYPIIPMPGACSLSPNQDGRQEYVLWSGNLTMKLSASSTIRESGFGPWAPCERAKTRIRAFLAFLSNSGLMNRRQRYW